MSDELSLDNFSGLELFEKICSSRQGRSIVKEIESKALNGWKAKDFPDEVSVDGIKKLKKPIRLPNKQPFEKFEIAIDAMTYHLLVKVDSVWQQSGFIIKTRGTEPAKE